MTMTKGRLLLVSPSSIFVRLLLRRIHRFNVYSAHQGGVQKARICDRSRLEIERDQDYFCNAFFEGKDHINVRRRAEWNVCDAPTRGINYSETGNTKSLNEFGRELNRSADAKFR